MELCGKSKMEGTANVIFLSAILGEEGLVQAHKCDWKCESEHICGNIYRCKLTGLTHICDKNCDQRILYDSQSSLCRVSGRLFPFTDVEERAVRGIRRKLEVDDSDFDGCSSKRRRDADFHPSPFEKAFRAVVGPICSHAGDGMDMD
uniref:Uncharacterized protein n=1 Tax=Kalanchoe fedtschenkoi TaxID=63787 RepID=A0A7N0SWD1_KALFE